MHIHVECLCFPLPSPQYDFNAVRFLLQKAKQSMVLQFPARLQVCSHGLVVHMTDKMKVFELMASIKEIYHISDIREVCVCIMYMYVVIAELHWFCSYTFHWKSTLALSHAHLLLATSNKCNIMYMQYLVGDFWIYTSIYVLYMFMHVHTCIYFYRCTAKTKRA